MRKNQFLVVYDYGMGGLWGIMEAHSIGEITDKYPMLTVFEYRPHWMMEEDYKRIANTRFDIDEPSGWLLSLGKSD